MGVYVDDMKAPFGRMIMCHLLADTDAELHAMAAKIGVARRWHQYPGTVKSHYDICLSKRAKAVAAGAIEVDARGVVAILRIRREALLGRGAATAPAATGRDSNQAQGSLLFE